MACSPCQKNRERLEREAAERQRRQEQEEAARRESRQRAVSGRS